MWGCTWGWAWGGIRGWSKQIKCWCLKKIPRENLVYVYVFICHLIQIIWLKSFTAVKLPNFKENFWLDILFLFKVIILQKCVWKQQIIKEFLSHVHVLYIVIIIMYNYTCSRTIVNTYSFLDFSTINHIHNIVDGNTGFSNISCYHNFPHSLWRSVKYLVRRHEKTLIWSTLMSLKYHGRGY